MEICKIDDCTGCQACINVCPKKAINIKLDKYGHIYPNIDSKLCINCGLCYKKCPNNNLLNNNEKKYFISWSEDEQIKDLSTSGGVCSSVAKYIIANNGVVYSPVFDCSGLLSYKRHINFESYKKSIGSKYTYACIGDNMFKIKKDLDRGSPVLIIGSPCQIAGIKSFLGKEYDNLITIDFICGGVPSNQLLKDYLNRIHVLKQNIINISFRDKHLYRLLINCNDRNSIIKRDKSAYYISFDYKLSQRNSCFNCRYVKNNVSDLTVGDYWGNNKVAAKSVEAISVVICNTSKGENILSTIDLKRIQSNFDIVSQNNDRMKSSLKKDIFRILLDKMLFNNKYNPSLIFGWSIIKKKVITIINFVYKLKSKVFEKN